MDSQRNKDKWKNRLWNSYDNGRYRNYNLQKKTSTREHTTDDI